MVRERLKQLPPGWVPPYERELEAEQQQPQASPERNIYERFEAAAQLLRERRASFTEEQERRFLGIWEDLDAAYAAEHPGKETPGLRYDKHGLFECVWPVGWFAEARRP